MDPQPGRDHPLANPAQALAQDSAAEEPLKPRAFKRRRLGRADYDKAFGILLWESIKRSSSPSPASDEEWLNTIPRQQAAAAQPSQEAELVGASFF